MLSLKAGMKSYRNYIYKFILLCMIAFWADVFSITPDFHYIFHDQKEQHSASPVNNQATLILEHFEVEYLANEKSCSPLLPYCFGETIFYTDDNYPLNFSSFVWQPPEMI